MSTKEIVDCEYYLVDARFFDYPWCMSGGTETNPERCKQCLEEQRLANAKKKEAESSNT